MDATLMLWLVLAIVALLVEMLAVVGIARGMEKGQPAIRAHIPGALARALGLHTDPFVADTGTDTEKRKDR